MTIELALALGTFMLLVLGAVGTAWWRMESKVDKARSDGSLRTEAVAAIASETRKELDAHKLHVAEAYVSKQGHREATDQIMTALDSVKSSIDGTNQRIDRLFENSAKRTRSST